MDLSRLFKPYLYGMITIGNLILFHTIFNNSITVNWLLLLVITMTAYSEFESFKNQLSNKGFSMSLGVANDIIILLYFGLPEYILAIMVVSLVLSIYKKELKLSNSVIDIKYIFNVSQFIVAAFITTKLINLLNYNINNIYEIWKIIIIISVYVLLNTIFVVIIAGLSSNTNPIKLLKFNEISVYLYYGYVYTIAALFLYKNEGILGLIIIYLLFIPFQRVTHKHADLVSLQNELFRDSLTGAYNFRFLESFVNNYANKNKKFCLTYMDLNKFKQINDTYGHEVGNEVLKHFAKIVMHNIADDMVFARYGGDEFCLLSQNLDDTKRICRKIKSDLETQGVKVGDTILYADVSIGIAGISVDSMSIKDAFEKADKAMYKSKHELGGELFIIE